MKKYAISDIHGCAKTFKALVEQINLTKEDKLFILGDYFDRGPDVKGVIDYIWQLQEEGFFVKCLMGNHEVMLIQELARPSGFYLGQPEVLISFRVNNIKDIPKKYIDWVKQLYVFAEVDEYILVHAGLNFKANEIMSDIDSMIWIRGWYDDIDKDWLKGRIVLHGHTPATKLEIQRSLRTLDEIPAIDIDGGCVFKREGLGYLCAFEMTERKLSFMRNIDN